MFNKALIKVQACTRTITSYLHVIITSDYNQYHIIVLNHPHFPFQVQYLTSDDSGTSLGTNYSVASST